MELPHIGKNCALKQCNQLDFLPVKCDSCGEVFCIQHYRYEAHNCDKARNKDIQVPACPLCSQPVATKRDQLPDIAVSQHIDQYCTSNELIKNRPGNKRPQTNLQSCSFKSCKQKDLIYLECKDCRSKFCIKHRHSSDHSCVGPSVANNLASNWQSFKGSCSTSATNSIEMIKNKAQQMGKSGQAALSRLKSSRPSSGFGPAANGSGNNNAIHNLQGNLSEQEALAIAMSESATTNNVTGNDITRTSRQQEEEDAALARALHESQMETRRRGTSMTNNQRDTCVLS